MAVQTITTDQLVTELGPALRALADPTRLKIMLMLRDGEQCTCHLTAGLGLTQGTISHHMGVLKKAGLVCDRQDASDARWVYYSLNGEEAARFVELFTQLLDTSSLDRTPADCRDQCSTDECGRGAKDGSV